MGQDPNNWTAIALQTAGMPSDDLRCKSWTEFTRSGAPRMDIVIALDMETLHDHPLWPGQPQTALWAYAPLVAKKAGSAELGLAAVQTLLSLRRRLELLVSLHSKVHNRADLRHDVQDLAHI